MPFRKDGHALLGGGRIERDAEQGDRRIDQAAC